MITDLVYRGLRKTPALQKQFRRVVSHLPHRHRWVRRFGQLLDVDPSELHGFYLYYENEYDDHIFDFLLSRLHQYRRALDIGANIGIYTVFFGSRLEQVDAFEPFVDVLPKLRENLKLNGISHVRIHETCVSNKVGEIFFSPPGHNNQGTGQVTSTKNGSLSLPSTSLDDFFGGPVNSPTIIKIDVEGAEWLILDGCKRSLGNRTALVDILLEIHPKQIEALGGSLDELQKALLEMNFDVRGLTPKGLAPISTADDCRFWWIFDQQRTALQR